MPTASTTRQIGDSSFLSIGFGGMGLSAYYGAAPPDEQRFKVRRRRRSHVCQVPNY